MTLGVRGGGWRCLVVWTAATTLVVGGWLRGWVLARPTWSAAWSGRLDALPLDQALTGLAATALLGCGAWAWAATTATVLEARQGRPSCRAPVRLPTVVRRVVLAACGVALVGGLAAPASAASEHGQHGLAGLPLPDRATSPRHHRPDAHLGRPRAGPGDSVVVVAPGDSLWSIAADHLPHGASDAEITARLGAVYAANRAVIGPDPDLLVPGQRLRLPGKDPS